MSHLTRAQVGRNVAVAVLGARDPGVVGLEQRPSVRRGAARWLVLVAALSVLWLVLAVPSASAFTLQQVGSELRFTAGTGEVNSVTVSLQDPATLSITDGGALLTGPAPAGCTDEGGGSVSCDRAGRASVTVLAGDGDDTATVDGTGLATVVDGGDGTDQLFGAAAADDLRGGGGNDVIDGGDGDDRLDGGPGDDQLAAGAGNDSAAGGEGTDSIAGDLGADALDGGLGDDDLAGGAGADTIAAGEGSNRIAGDEDGDLLVSGSGADVVDGGDGGDTVRAGGGRDIVDGGPGADTIAGEDGPDQLTQSDGGGVLDGGAGDDELQGSTASDDLRGAAGNDRLTGDSGADRLSGGDGVDALDGGPGADVQSGGAGADTSTYQFSVGRVKVTLDRRANDGTAREGDNVGSDIETVIGSVGDDRLFAGRSGTTLAGGPGRDRLTGSVGRDVLDGQEDDDLLDGGAGADKLVGGAGTDEATYAARSKPVRVSLDNRANDGGKGERDDVRSTVEDVTGGRGDDRFSGFRSVVNRFAGGRGDDRFRVLDDDSAIDQVQCGAGLDRTSADDRDRVGGDCENIARTGRSLAARLTGVHGRGGGRATGRVRCGFRTIIGCRGSVGLYVYTRSRRAFVGSTRLVADAGTTRRFTVRGGPRRLRRLARGRTTLRGIVALRVRDRLGRAAYLTRRVRVAVP